MSRAAIYGEPSSLWMKELLPSNSGSMLQRNKMFQQCPAPRLWLLSSELFTHLVLHRKSEKVISNVVIKLSNYKKNNSKNKQNKTVALCWHLFLPLVWQGCFVKACVWDPFFAPFVPLKKKYLSSSALISRLSFMAFPCWPQQLCLYFLVAQHFKKWRHLSGLIRQS